MLRKSSAAKVMIVGAGGLVGRHLADHFAGKGSQVSAFLHGDLDITDRDAVIRRLALEKPDLVINCAVIGVDLCEREPALAAAVNVDGPRNLAEGAEAVGAAFIHFSTNYVFGGSLKDRPFNIHDEPRPISVYGGTKLEGEREAAAICKRTFIIRTSWVFGPGKATFLSTIGERLLNGMQVHAITDMRANVTYVRDLAERVARVIEMDRYGTYQVVNSGVCSYFDFAMETARILGISEERSKQLIVPVKAEDMQPTAPRPFYSAMECTWSDEIGLEPMRAWQPALCDYLIDA